MTKAMLALFLPPLALDPFRLPAPCLQYGFHYCFGEFCPNSCLFFTDPSLGACRHDGVSDVR